MTLEFDKTTTIAENNRISKQIETYILQKEEISTLFSNVGGPSKWIGSLGLGAPNVTEYTIQLKPKEARGNISTEAFMQQLRSELKANYSGINYAIAALGLIPKSAPIEITLSGNNTSVVMKAGNLLKSVIEKIPGADNVRLSVQEGNPEYKIIPDKDKMQRLGLSTGYVGMNTRIAFSGNDDAKLTENGTEFPIRIWLNNFSRDNFEDVEHLNIINPKGISVEVAQFAKVQQDKSPSLLERKDRQSAVTLTSDALGRPSGTVADDVLAFLKENPLPEGITLSWGSDIKRQQDSFGALGSVLLISFI